MPRSDASTSSLSLSSSGSVARKKSRPFVRPKAPITSIPDMRFEQSFLASIRAFVHEVDAEDAKDMKEQQRGHKDDERRDEKNAAGGAPLNGFEEKGTHNDPTPSKAVKARAAHGEPEIWLGRLRIEWWSLMYLTVRDQLFSPILQGAVFGLGGLALTNVRGFLVARRQSREQR